MKKVTLTNYRKIWFGSDFHFGHNKDFIYKARGFSSVQEHDDAIIDSIVTNVTPEDCFVFLGDFSFDPSLDTTQKYINAIPGELLYIWGNHERNTRSFVNGADIAMLKIGQSAVVACHYPIAVWDGQHWGAMHVCGHTHGGYIPSLPDSLNSGKLLDVGVDVALKTVQRPFFEWPEVKAILDKKIIINNHV